MAGLHDISKKDFERLLKDNGFEYERSGKHHVWKRQSDGAIIPLPMGPKVSSPVARRMVKEYKLQGAPYGWSELAEKAEAKIKAAEQQREQEQKRQEEARRAKEQRTVAASAANREALEKAKTAIESHPTDVRHTAAPAQANKESLTPQDTIYMNEKRLENFHRYLIALVEYYAQNGKMLKNFSHLAPKFRVKGITQEQFAIYKLGDMKPAQIDRQFSDRIRLEIAEADRKRQEDKLKVYMEERDRQEQDGGNAEERKPHVPTLAERIDTFEARFDLLGPVFADITSQVYDYYKKEFGPHADELLGQDSWRVRMSPEQHLAQWAEDVEFDLTRIVFDEADPEEVRRLLPTWSEKILHAYLTWLYGGKDGVQLKLNFDERGCENSQNEELIELLQGQGLLEQMIFVKLESWKGCAHCCAIYNDAPDVLMIIGESEGEAGVDFYTVSDDVWYTCDGNTIINPDNCCEFSGWGTRSIVARCLRQMLSPDNHKAALLEQQKVTKQMRGKLTDDIRHYRDIWQMYHDEYEQKQRQGMIDFGN